MAQPPSGPWPSPLRARDVASAVNLRLVAYDGDAVWWEEARPAADGGVGIMRCGRSGTPQEVFAEQLAALGTRVGAWLPIAHDAIVLAGEDSPDLYLLRHGSLPRQLVRHAGDDSVTRYTELVLGLRPDTVNCVQKRGLGLAADYSIVEVPLDASRRVRTLLTTPGPVAAPRLSPDGRVLAWLGWEASQMPWDGAQLYVGRICGSGVTDIRVLLGGAGEAVFQVEWANAGSLYVISDRSRWWNPYEVRLDGTLRPLCPMPEEFGWPLHRPDLATYGRLRDGRLAVVHGCGDWQLDLLDPADGVLTPLDLSYTAWQPTLRASEDEIAGVAGTATRPAALVLVRADDGTCQVIRETLPDIPEDYLPPAHPVSLRGRDGHLVHAVVYPPHNPDVTRLSGERVPYLLDLRCEPGMQEPGMLDPTRAYFTSRGIGVAAVMPRGSSGYGRAYREAVYGRWGVADVEDCAIVAHHLTNSWQADPDRLAVRAYGATAMTALELLAHADLCAAATVYAPVTDLESLPPDTLATQHLRQIASDLIAQRPASWLDRIRRPVLMLHGLDDAVVPAAQSEVLRDALRRHHVRHRCQMFPNEGHRLRRADTISRALEAELAFYADIFRFNNRPRRTRTGTA